MGLGLFRGPRGAGPRKGGEKGNARCTKQDEMEQLQLQLRGGQMRKTIQGKKNIKKLLKIKNKKERIKNLPTSQLPNLRVNSRYHVSSTPALEKKNSNKWGAGGIGSRGEGKRGKRARGFFQSRPRAADFGLRTAGFGTGKRIRVLRGR